MTCCKTPETTQARETTLPQGAPSSVPLALAEPTQCCCAPDDVAATEGKPASMGDGAAKGCCGGKD